MIPPWPALEAVWSYPMLGATADLLAMRAQATHAVVAIGNNDARAALTQRLRQAGFQMMTGGIGGPARYWRQDRQQGLP